MRMLGAHYREPHRRTWSRRSRRVFTSPGASRQHCHDRWDPVADKPRM